MSLKQEYGEGRRVESLDNEEHIRPVLLRKTLRDLYAYTQSRDPASKARNVHSRRMSTVPSKGA